MVAKRRRDYFKHVEGQLSFEDLLKLAEEQEGEHDGEQVRRDGPQPLGTVAAAAVRGDQRSGQLLLDIGQEAARQIDELTTELAGDGQPGEDYLARAGRLAAARSQAEEIVLPQQVLPPPEPGASEDPEENDPPPASTQRPLVIGRSHPLWAEINAEQEERLQGS